VSTTFFSDLVPYGSVRSGKLVLYGPVTTLPADTYRIALRQKKSLRTPQDNDFEGFDSKEASEADDSAMYCERLSKDGNLPAGLGLEMVNWDTNTSQDISSICMLLHPRWGLILSPVRKPGAEGLFQRAGFVYDRGLGGFTGQEFIKRPGGIGFYEGHPDWHRSVVTVI
jgi:hypothetical protein